MPKKDVVTEITETTEITNVPAAEPVVETAADPAPVSDAATEVPATSAETTGTAETTEMADAIQTPADAPASVVKEPDLMACITLHGRLTHEGKTYAPHERVILPVDVALGLIDSGHVAKAD